MLDRTERYTSYPVIAVALLAFALFAIWQLTYHLVFMELIPVRGMFASHMLSLAAETVFAALLTLYFVRIVVRQNRELQQLDHQKNVLVDSLVHDLHQPLTAVIGGLSSLVLAGELPKPASELAAIAQDGASRLLHMVNDLLDVTRLEAGAPLLWRQQDACAPTVPSALSRGHQLRYATSNGIPMDSDTLEVADHGPSRPCSSHRPRGPDWARAALRWRHARGWDGAR